MTRFGTGTLLLCRNIYDSRTAGAVAREQEKNILVAKAIMYFWDDSVKKQRAPFLPQLPGKYSSEGAAREWSTVVIVIVIFMT